MSWTWRSALAAFLIGSVLVGAASGAEPEVLPSKLRAKFGGKKITIKGKVVAAEDWPVTLRVELLDPQDRVLSSASDSLRPPDSFQIELTPMRGKKFEREDLAEARVRYSLIRARTVQGEQTVALGKICPNLAKRKHKWWW